MVIGRRMGWASADEGGRWRSWGQGCLLPAPLAGSWPQNGSGLRRCAGREQAGGPGREQAARPPACTGCVRGLGTRVPPTTAAHTRLPGQALGHSLPAFLLPPSSTVLQLRIHRRYQDTSLSGSFAASPFSDPDPWISAADPALAPAPASPSSPAPFLFSPGVLLPEPKHYPWRSLKKESSKISQHWREPKPKKNLTYHQYMPPEPRQGSRADPQAEGSALGPPGPPPWEWTNSQQPPPRSPQPLALSTQVGTSDSQTGGADGLRAPAAAAPAGPPSVWDQVDAPGAHARWRPAPRAAEAAARGRSGGCSLASLQAQGFGSRWEAGLVEAESDISLAAPSTCRGNPCDGSGSCSGSGCIDGSGSSSSSSSSTDSFFSSSLDSPDTGGGAAGSDPQSADMLPPIPLDFPGSFDLLSPSPDSEGLSSVFSSSLPSPTNSPSPSPRGPTDSLDWLEALSGGPPLGCGPPAPSIFSADLSDSSGTRLWDLLEDPW
ncbi:MEF2-activating motif and SAP domain-containing transcriptional regulator isoform X4 [Sagmatias obliquidens]|uniref:MEF2-activating motif and SAP domain-containing transcriptional regulator isoform X4 n=1 Tax=Sagmatias obliquidens TaxID=3371155 RepID=UPI000F441AD5|nr:MEF2-activating motif and SAP domain-containing transcriptional regulator isoform X4 [Lagenorhynchus obliquidens]